MVKVPGSNKSRLVNGNLMKNVGQFFGHFQFLQLIRDSQGDSSDTPFPKS